jgi:uncharacterized protein (DUF342 family)
MVIFKNQYIKIIRREDGFYLESYEKGFTINDFNKVLSLNPDIKISSFSAIRNALLNAPQLPVKFGELRDRIIIETVNNDMNTFVTLSIDNSERTEGNKNLLLREIIEKLKGSGVVFGIKTDALVGCLSSRAPVLVAEGIPPVNGEDSVIRMYELKEPHPEIKDDGKVDYYELNLINKVSEGDWLGERTDPTEGTPGKTVKGDIVKPLAGRRLPLFYDPNTVTEVYKDGVTTLYSKINGAVHYTGDKISVSNYLEITKDVDFNTGNVDFDGFLTVKGAVSDNFSVAAKNDIEILGKFGVGSVKEILSRHGNICITGGIAGKNKAVVKSTKDIYTKYISDATVICEGTVYVGYYCMNSNITAKQLIVESGKGQIIGGTVTVEQKVSAASIGNAGEKRTQITVTGFDRKAVKERMENLQKSLQTAKSRLAKAKQVFAVYSYSIETGSRQYDEFEAAKEAYFSLKDEVKKLENELKSVVRCFRVKGEGEIEVTRRLYPNTFIEMKDDYKDIRSMTLATCYYLQDGIIKEI